MKLSDNKKDEPILERFELWADKLARYIKNDLNPQSASNEFEEELAIFLSKDSASGLPSNLYRFLPAQINTHFECSDSVSAYFYEGSDKIILLNFKCDNEWYHFTLMLSSLKYLPYSGTGVRIKSLNGKSGHAFKTRQEIIDAHPKKINPLIKRTPFEKDAIVQNYVIQEHNQYDINSLVELQENKSLPAEYKRWILLSESKDDNLLNFIIRAIQNKIINIDDGVYQRLVRLLEIESIIKHYNRQNSNKSSFQIIQETIRNSKIQTTFNGFKRLIVSSLIKQGRSAYADEQKHKQGRSAYAFESEDNPKEKSPVWLDHLDADKYYKINKTTFYREIERNKNDKTRVTYALKQLSQRYCEDLSERLKIRNDKIEGNKDIIPAIAKHFKVAPSTVQKHLPFYWKKYKKVIAQEKEYSIQEKNKIPAIIHPKREIIRHPLKH